MQKRYIVARLAVAVGVVLPLVSCAFFDRVQATKIFKDANALYQRGDFEGAAKAYEEVTALPVETILADPNLTAAYFYLANSYDNLYRPGRRGEPENDAYLEKAIQNYRLGAERSQDPALKMLAMQFLVAAYGPDKMNDPNQSEPILLQMIEVDPQNPDNYVVLARLYEEAGQYESAEQTLLKVREARPDDTTVYLQLAAFYNRNDEFEKTIEALQERAAREPNNPEAFYTIGTYYWEKAFRDFRLTENDKRQYIMAGLETVDKAIALKADYAEALTYKNILLRMQANMERDLDKQRALIAQADELRTRAEQLMKQKTAGVS